MAKAIGAIVVVAIVLVQTHLIGNPFFRTSEESNSDNGPMTPTASVSFCKKVHDNLIPIGTADLFSGGEVYIRLESNTAFGLPSLNMYNYKMIGSGEASSLFDSQCLHADPHWNRFAMAYNVTQICRYRVVLQKYGNDDLAVGAATMR